MNSYVNYSYANATKSLSVTIAIEISYMLKYSILFVYVIVPKTAHEGNRMRLM